MVGGRSRSWAAAVVGILAVLVFKPGPVRPLDAAAVKNIYVGKDGSGACYQNTAGNTTKSVDRITINSGDNVTWILQDSSKPFKVTFPPEGIFTPNTGSPFPDNKGGWQTEFASPSSLTSQVPATVIYKELLDFNYSSFNYDNCTKPPIGIHITRNSGFSQSYSGSGRPGSSSSFEVGCIADIGS